MKKKVDKIQEQLKLNDMFYKRKFDTIGSAIKQFVEDVNANQKIYNKAFEDIGLVHDDIAKRLNRLESKNCCSDKNSLVDFPNRGDKADVDEIIDKSTAVASKNYFAQAKKMLLDYANKTMVKKGQEYTPNGDRFANFRPILNQDKTAMQKLLGYCEKHVQYIYMQSENPTCNDINELLEHYGDVFNYNILGMAMKNTDIPNSVSGYADRNTQERAIESIIDEYLTLTKEFTNNSGIHSKSDCFFHLLNDVAIFNLVTITNKLAKQLERLDNE